MPRSIVRLIAFAFYVCQIPTQAAEPIELSQPIFQTGVPHPTQDKPQSKLWFAHNRYWAWLPIPNGSAILEQTSSGWKELVHLRASLAGLPGQADVWNEPDLVRGVLVGHDRLAVVELKFDLARDTYQTGSLRYEFKLPGLEPKGDELETASIARDSRGTWWVAFDRDLKIFVSSTTDDAGQAWSIPQAIASNTHRDDIAAIFALRDRIGVLWSDQIADAVLFREHLDHDPAEKWSDTIVVEQGGKTADDHLNGALADDGTLYVATKNSRDEVGKPQQVLRIRRANGQWENHSYALLHERIGPSRPIALLAGRQQQLYLLHTNYDRRDPQRRRDHIAGLVSSRQPIDLDGIEFRLMSAAKPLNNVTGTKRSYPENVPWVVLASDADGGVYAAALPPAIRK